MFNQKIYLMHLCIIQLHTPMVWFYQVSLLWQQFSGILLCLDMKLHLWEKKCNSFSYSEIVLLCVWSFAMLIFTPPHLLPQLFSKIQVSSLNYHRAENCSSVCLSFLFLLQKIKGIVHPLIKILSLFSHWCRPDTWLSFFSGTHKENFWTIIGLHFNIMKVNDWVLSKSY